MVENRALVRVGQWVQLNSSILREVQLHPSNVTKNQMVSFDFDNFNVEMGVTVKTLHPSIKFLKEGPGDYRIFS